MKNKTGIRKWQNLVKYGLFLLLALIIIQLLPQEKAFTYNYEEGKPWKSDLLIAPFDIPIYKSEKQLEEERAKLLKSFIPYYKINLQMGEDSFRRFFSDIQQLSDKKLSYESILLATFNEIYSSGIIPVADFDSLSAQGAGRIYCVLPNHVAELRSLKDIYTPKTAYEKIIESYPDPEGKEILSTYMESSFFTSNLTMDFTRSQAERKEILKNLSTTKGFVKYGDSIIGKGELVTPKVYSILQSLEIEIENRELTSTVSVLTLSLMAKAILVIGFVSLLFFFFYLFRPLLFEHYNNLFLVLLLVLIIVGVSSFTIHFQSRMVHYYMVPYAILPIIIRVFLDSRTAFFAHLLSSLIVSLMLPEPYIFLVLQFAAGMIALFSMKDMVMRSQLAQSAICIFLCYSFIYLCFNIASTGDLAKVDFVPILFFAANALLILFSYILIYLFEKLFGFISSVTLVELTNVNSDFMMEFAEQAPGSFQHSLQVSNLAMEAAKKINANSLLVRTGALYHDIGKMNNPAYFTENQVSENKNPLLNLEYEEAARIIIDHVPEGVRIAKRLHLPEQIIHFIQTHHGTSKVMYFYNSYINANPDLEPNEAAFTYPGPLPDTKETAILMMADAVEARSRSLKEYTEESISAMVEDMVDFQIADGQLKNAPISFRDVEMAKEAFKQKLSNIYHTRITYPKANTQELIPEQETAPDNETETPPDNEIKTSLDNETETSLEASKL